MKNLKAFFTLTLLALGAHCFSEAVPKAWQQLYDKMSETIVRKDIKAYMSHLDKAFVNVKSGERTGFDAYASSFKAFLQPFSHIRARAIASNYRAVGDTVTLDYHYTFTGVYKDKTGKTQTLSFFEDGIDTWHQVRGRYLELVEDVKKQGLDKAI